MGPARLSFKILPFILLIGSAFAAPFRVMLPARAVSSAGVELQALDGEALKYRSPNPVVAPKLAAPAITAPCKANLRPGGLHCCKGLGSRFEGVECKPITKDPWNPSDFCPKGYQFRDFTYACCDEKNLGKDFACTWWANAKHGNDHSG